MKQNYFEYKDLQYIQEDGRAVDALTSSSFSEIYLQYFENTKIFDILVKHPTIRHCRYVDDILLVYQNSATNIHEVLNTSNKQLNPCNAFHYGRRSW